MTHFFPRCGIRGPKSFLTFSCPSSVWTLHNSRPLSDAGDLGLISFPSRRCRRDLSTFREPASGVTDFLYCSSGVSFIDFCYLYCPLPSVSFGFHLLSYGCVCWEKPAETWPPRHAENVPFATGTGFRHGPAAHTATGKLRPLPGDRFPGVECDTPVRDW